MKKIDAAYIAGVMDSDGSFTIMEQPHRTTGQPAFVGKASIHWTISTEAKAVLLDFKGRYDGWVHSSTPDPKRPNNRPMIEWGVSKRKDLVPFLQAIIPYLRLKKHRAEVLLEFALTIRENNGLGRKKTLPASVIKRRQYLRNTLVKLNKRGNGLSTH